MATINHSAGADIIVPNNNGTTYRGLGGDDTYILSNSIAANAAITIVDTSGSNTIQLVDGLSVASTKFAADAVQLTLSNGAVVTINGASNFSFDLGGNSTAGITGSVSDFTGFAATAGVTSLPASGSVAGASNVSVTGTSWSGGSATYSYTVSKDASQIAEGESVNFTVTSSSAVTADTTLSWTVIGDDNGGTVTKATATDLDAQSGTVTIAAGSTTGTFAVKALADSIAEGIEGIQVSVFSPESATVGTSSLLVTNTGASSSAQSFSGSTGVDNLVGASGADTFDFSTTGQLNDVDTLDGGAGKDILNVSQTGAVTLTPNVENIETLNVTPATGTVTVNLANTESTFDKLALVSGGAIATTFNDVAVMPGKIAIINGSGALTLNLKAGGVAGTETVNIELAGSTTGADIAVTDDGTGKVEAATINSISAANVLTTMALNGASSLTITGDKALTLTQALEATVLTVDAGAMTGATGLTLSANPAAAAGITITGGAGIDSLRGTTAGNDNISAGGGNDTITFGGSGAQFNALDVVDGGAGSDTVAVDNTAIVSSVLGGLSNVETLQQTVAGSITLTSNVGPTNFNVSANSAQVVSFNEGYSAASTVTILGDTDSTDTINNNSNIDLTVVAYSDDFVEDNTVINGSATATDTITIYANGDGDWDTNSAATIVNIDNVNFLSTKGLTGSYSGNTSMDLGVISTPITVTSSLSALDGSLTLDFSEAATKGTVNYTGGAGVDIITGGTLNDVITTGGGNDTVTSTSGVNTIDTGAGVDIINMGTGVDVISSGDGNDTIVAGASDLLANDVIDGGAGTDVLEFAATTYSDESVFGGLTNVESIKGTAANGISQTLTFNGNIDTTIIDASAAGNTILNLNAGYTNATTVKLGADTTNADVIVNGGATAANIDLTVTATDSGSFDTGTSITGGTGTDTITLTNTAATDAMVLTNATSIDVLNLIDSTTGLDISVTGGANAAVPLTVNATTMDSGEVLTGDFSAATGGVTINAGGGADILTGGTVNDVIYGNGGIDTIDGQENSATKGADAIYGGAGNDIINVSTAESEFSNSSTTALVTDTVDGGAGTDTLAFNDVAVTLTKAELANISNVEKLTLVNASTITLSDDFLTNNPGVSITLAAGTIKAGAGTTADPTITKSLVYTAGNGNINVTGGTADDTFNTAAGAVFDVSDTINGGAGTDTINVSNENTYGTTNTTGDAVTLALDIYHTNIEKVVVLDNATDDTADVTISIAAAYTGTALTIDASALDQNALSTANEALLLTQAAADTAALTVLGGEGADSITTGASADHITGNGGIDTISSNAGNDSIYAGAGNDIIDTGAGRDYAEGGAGNDTFNIATDSHFEVSGGTETLDGGAGTDILSFDAASTHDISAAELGSVKNIEQITIAATTSTNQTTLGLSDTFMNNNAGQATIFSNTTANANADHLIDASSVGTTGTVTLILAGNTTGKNDTLLGGGGDDILQVGYKGLAAASASDLEATDKFTGNGGTDTIVYDTQADGTNGGEGAITATIDFDLITGVEKILVKDADGSGAAADVIVTTLSTGVTTANVPTTFEYDGSVKTDADDTQNFNYNDLTSADNDALTTDFTITTGAGADSVGGSGGDDTITTGAGADNVFGGGRSDTIDGGSGDDNLYGGDETATTGVGDSITGGSGADTIDGDAGADTLIGGDGADIITGGTGADVITGGSGNDVFLLPTGAESAGTSLDTITDLETGLDTIKITVTAAQSDSNAVNFAATDLGDVSTFAEVEAILGGNAGEAVFVKDTAQLVIDYNGDANINSSDIRINLTGATGYDDGDVAYILGLDNDTARSYTLGDGADSVTGGAGVIVDTINGNGGADTINGGAGADIISGGAGADSITGGAGVDVVTGGAGNDTIILTTGEADVWVASAATTAAPYAATNTGSDTVTMFAGTGLTIFRLWPLSTVAGAGGSDGWLSITGSSVLSDVTANDGNAEVNTNIIALDDGTATHTASTLAARFQTTVSTGDNYLKMTDDGGGIVVHGDAGGATTKVYIWWVDSGLDGDGTDVTAADVKLLVTSSTDLDLDLVHTDQFDV